MVHTCNPSNLKGAEEVTQWLKALGAPLVDPGLILRIYMVVNNHLLLQFQGIQQPMASVGTWYTCGPQTYM